MIIINVPVLVGQLKLYPRNANFNVWKTVLGEGLNYFYMYIMVLT